MGVVNESVVNESRERESCRRGRRRDRGNDVSDGSPAIGRSTSAKTFDRGIVTALDGLTMRVESGEYVASPALVRCGKSTLMHLLAALDHPDSGTLRVNGRDITHPDHVNRYRRHDVGLVLHNLLPHSLDARSNVMRSPCSGTQRRASRRADGALEDGRPGRPGSSAPP